MSQDTAHDPTGAELGDGDWGQLLRPKVYRPYPHLSLARAARLIHHLEGSEADENIQWEERILSHGAHLSISRLGIVLRPVLVVGFLLSVILTVVLPFSINDYAINLVFILSFVAVSAGYLLVFPIVNPSYYRFFRFIEKAKKSASKGDNFASREIGIVDCVNNSGKAAQSLFRVLQGRKSTWGAPPAVADRALTLAYPMIDVKIDYYSDPRAVQEVLDKFVEFLDRAAVLVAMQRADLIPELREVYDDSLSPRRLSHDEAIRERDVRFLNPFQDYDRGGVLRDYIYPLGTWMSFLVSLVALATSLLK